MSAVKQIFSGGDSFPPVSKSATIVLCFLRYMFIPVLKRLEANGNAQDIRCL